jgi:hypothetical protein
MAWKPTLAAAILVGATRIGGLNRLYAPVPVARKRHCVHAAADRGALTRPILMAVQRAHAPMNAAGVAARSTARCSRSKPPSPLTP